MLKHCLLGGMQPAESNYYLGRIKFIFSHYSTLSIGKSVLFTVQLLFLNPQLKKSITNAKCTPV